MMKSDKNKTFIALLVAIFMSINVFAAQKIGGIYYKFDSATKTAIVTNSDDGQKPTAITGSYIISSIVIPLQVTFNDEVYDVIAIDDYAFYGSNSIGNITIPNSITSIGDCAFYNCTGLSSISIPNSVTSIGNQVFRGCIGLNNITLSENLTSLGSECFRLCKWLTQISLPDKIKTLNDGLFYNCTSLVSVNLPDSLQTIGNDVFFGTTKLKKIELPEGVLSIGSNAFPSSLDTIICKAVNPPTFISSSSFANSSAKVYVPCSSASDYKNGAWGTEFANIYTESLATEISLTVCSGTSLFDGKLTATTSGIFYDTLTSYQGCDSIITLNLTVNPSYDTLIEVIILSGDTYTLNGFTQQTAGNYIQNLQTADGCDSIIRLSLTTLKVDTVTLVDTLTIHDTTIITQTDTLTIHDTITDIIHDTTVVIQTDTLTIHDTTIVIQTDTLTIHDTTILTQLDTLILYDTITNEIILYDTIFVFDTIIPCATARTYIYATINSGDTYSDYGFNTSEAGTHVLTLQTEDGCDSIVTLYLQLISGIENISETKIITVYPNPAKDVVTIKADGDVTVFNNKGQVVKIIKDVKGIKEINIADLQSGVYYVKVGDITKKLIVE